MRSRTRHVAMVLLVASAGVGVTERVSFAETAADMEQEQERTAAYKEGLSLAEGQHWDQALVKFQRVVAIRSAPPALVALGTAEEKLGMLTHAKRSYTKARADASGTGERAIEEKATLRLEALSARIPRVTIRLSRESTGAVVMVDGQRIDITAQPLEIDPGDHLLSYSVEGGAPSEQKWRVQEGDKKEIWVELAAAATKADRAQAPHAGPPVGVFVLGGAGIVATAIGVIVFAKGRSDYDDARAHCPNDLCASADLARPANAARDRMLGGSLLAGAGIAAAAGAGVWWMLSTRDEGAQSSGSRRGAQQQIGFRLDGIGAGSMLRMRATF